MQVLMSGGRDSSVRVWDMRTKSQVHCLTGIAYLSIYVGPLYILRYQWYLVEVASSPAKRTCIQPSFACTHTHMHTHILSFSFSLSFFSLCVYVY